MQHWTPPSFDPHAEPAVPVGTVDDRIPVTAPVAPVTEPLGHAQALFLRGLQEGLEEGRQQGLALGREEGFEKGREDGFQAGFQQGYQSSLERVDALTRSLQSLMDALTTLPSEIEAAMGELVYETALRLAAKESMDRVVIQRAVQGVLAGLPRPGEDLVLRVPQADHDSWSAIMAQGSAGMPIAVQVDESVPSGHAFVEIRGMRLDLGARARQALVRGVLGLLSSDHADAKV